MEQKKIDRINFLAKKAKTEGLSDSEKEEQRLLREEYILAYRASLRGILDNTVVQYPDGRKEPIKKDKK